MAKMKCEAMKPNPKYYPFGFGPEYTKRYFECENDSEVELTEKATGKKTVLCPDCFIVFCIQEDPSSVEVKKLA